MDGAPTRFDSLIWQSASRGELGDLASLVDAAHGKPQEHVVFETILVEDENPLEVIHPRDASLFDVRTIGAVSVMQISDDSGSFTLSAWPTAYPGVFHLVGGIPATDTRWGKVDRWVRNAAPAAVRCFLDHDDFTDIGTALSEHAPVEVQRLTGRMRQGRSSYSRGFPALAGDELRPDHHEIIGEAEKHGAAVRTMHLHVGDVADVVVRRQAGATFIHGDFSVFEASVLNRLALAAHRRREMMSNRQRVVDERPRQPIEIRLAYPMFSSPEATGLVLSELDIPANHLTYAVMHRNPYLHVVVTDDTDGSNYDVFVTRPDTIEIHPGFRASLGSLARIAQQLGDRFEAVTFGEQPPPAPVSFYDLVDSFQE